MKKKILIVGVLILGLFSSPVFGGSENTFNTFYGTGAGAGVTNPNLGVTFIGANAGNANTTGGYNTFLGYYAGYTNTTGYDNTFLGYVAGYFNTTGIRNTFIGNYAGRSNTTGSYNTFIGHYAGYANTTGNANTFLGNYAGRSHTTGVHNTFIGYGSGYLNTTGNYNTFLGLYAGYYNTTGHNNTFLGYSAGLNETGSNRLYIANSSTATPLIYGEFDNQIMTVNGKLGIGTQSPVYPLHMASGAYVSAGGVWINASSREYKENIKALPIKDAVEALAGLNPVTFQYKISSEKGHVGFIAEDVPDLLATKDRKGLSAMDVVAVLTKVLQEQQKVTQQQQKIIAEQKKINQDQQKLIQELSKKMTKLEKQLKAKGTTVTVME